MNAFLRQNKKAKVQFLVVVGIILVAILSSFNIRHKPESVTSTGEKENSILVESVTVVPENLKIQLSKTGTVEARNFIGVVPEVNGRVVALGENFKVGSSFFKDEVLFKIDPIDYQLQLDRAYSNLKRSETDLMIEKAESESAIAEWKSLNSKREVPTLVARIPQLEQVKSILKSSESEVADAQLDLDRTSFKFSFAGKVVAANIEVGQYLRAGNEYGKVYNTDSLEIVIPIEKEYISWFKAKESKVSIEIESLSSKDNITGVVDRISADLSAQTRFAKIYVKPEVSSLNLLLPGTFVEVELEGPELEGVWKIPNKAFQDAENVWIIDQENKLQKLSPKVISIGDKFTIVKGNGREEKLVSSMLVGASNGMSVEIIEENN